MSRFEATNNNHNKCGASTSSTAVTIAWTMNDSNSATVEGSGKPTATKRMTSAKTVMPVAISNPLATIIQAKATRMNPKIRVEPPCPSDAANIDSDEDAIIEIIDMAQAIVDSSDLEPSSEAEQQQLPPSPASQTSPLATSTPDANDVQVIESTLIEKLSIRFVDARNLATKARLDLGIKGYPSKIQRGQVVRECVKRFYKLPIETQETMKQDKCIFDSQKEAISVASRTTATTTMTL